MLLSKNFTCPAWSPITINLGKDYGFKENIKRGKKKKKGFLDNLLMIKSSLIYI